MNRILALVLFTVPVIAAAEPIYSWKDAQGTVHYSTKASVKEATKADLPPITRANVKVSTAALSTCTNHGGVNCQAGQDTDGTVICYLRLSRQYAALHLYL